MRVKTRLLTKKESADRLKSGCPKHGGTLVVKERLVRDRESDERKNGGWYLCCPLYLKNVRGRRQCEYYLSPGKLGETASESVLEE